MKRNIFKHFISNLFMAPATTHPTPQSEEAFNHMTNNEPATAQKQDVHAPIQSEGNDTNRLDFPEVPQDDFSPSDGVSEENQANVLDNEQKATDGAEKGVEPVSLEEVFRRGELVAMQIGEVTHFNWFKLSKLTTNFKTTKAEAAERMVALVQMGYATMKNDKGEVKFKIQVSPQARIKELQKMEAQLVAELSAVQNKIAMHQAEALKGIAENPIS